MSRKREMFRDTSIKTEDRIQSIGNFGEYLVQYSFISQNV